MARVMHYLDEDVYTAAKARIHHIYDTHDRVIVLFSGGKDSLVVLHLTWDVAQERGLSHVDVVFRDEELIPDSVIAFVDGYREQPWVKMRYYAVPLKSSKFILGKAIDYVQWDPERPHLRPIPAHAITLPAGDRRVFDQYSMDAFIAEAYKGKLAFLNGIRAQESLMRYRSCVSKLHENYICASSSPRVALCKPIYDWKEDDVFKYFYDHNIRYCPLYDAQHLIGDSLRVSTPLHAESAKRFGRLRQTCPQFYQQIVTLFPEILVQERYWDELDRDAIKRRYAASFEGIRAYIEDNIEEGPQRDLALKRLRDAMVGAKTRPDAFHPEYVLNYFVTGAFKRKLVPCPPSRQKSHWKEAQP